MSDEVRTALIVGGIVLAVLVIAALVAIPYLRRRRLQSRFGAEYDHLVSARGDRSEAEAELAERQKRHDKLELRPLPDESKDRYAAEWRLVQEHFVDEPAEATGEADQLITRVMADRGYPTKDFEQQAADLSVEHARTLNSYRTAHSLAGLVSRRSATTEDMRQAMVHYRTVFAELVEREIGRTGPFADPGDHDGALDETIRTDGRIEDPARNDGQFTETGGRVDDRAVGAEHHADEHPRPRDVDADQRVPRPR
jgi:hypothetical protein